MRAVRDIKGNAMKLIKLLTAGVFAGLAVTTGQASASVLDTVKQRGTLNCGTDNTAPVSATSIRPQARWKGWT